MNHLLTELPAGGWRTVDDNQIGLWHIKTPCTFSGIGACIDQAVWAMRLNSFATRNPFCDLSKPAIK